MVDRAVQISRKKGKQLAYDRIRFQTVEFGRCVQCFHPGDDHADPNAPAHYNWLITSCKSPFSQIVGTG